MSLTYNPKSKTVGVDIKNLDMVYHSLLYAIRSIRELAGLPLDKYEQKGPLTAADHAQKGILDAAKLMGIDMGAEWGERLDVRREK